MNLLEVNGISKTYEAGRILHVPDRELTDLGRCRE